MSESNGNGSVKGFSREEILAIPTQQRETTLIKARGTGGGVYVRMMMRDEYEAYGAALREGNDIKALAMVVCDENGKLLFNPEDPEDAKLLALSLPAPAILDIARGASEFSSINPALIAKNSEASPTTALASA